MKILDHMNCASYTTHQLSIFYPEGLSHASRNFGILHTRSKQAGKEIPLCRLVTSNGPTDLWLGWGLKT